MFLAASHRPYRRSIPDMALATGQMGLSALGCTALLCSRFRLVSHEWYRVSIKCVIRKVRRLMKRLVRANKKLLPQRLVLNLIIGLLIMAWPRLLSANGGTTLLVQEVGAYEILVTASPHPLQVGANDISVLVARLSDARLVLEADIIITAEPVGKPGERQTFLATHAQATNKLYFAADVNLPTPGRWQLTVQVDGPEDSVSTTVEAEVVQQQFWGLPRYLSLIGLSLVAIAFLLFVLNRRASERLNSHLEKEQA